MQNGKLGLVFQNILRISRPLEQSIKPSMEPYEPHKSPVREAGPAFEPLRGV